MIKGTGIDIIQVDRIAKSLQKPGFKNHVFTKNEQDYCDSTSSKWESYAGKFTAKESFLKALGIGVLDGLPLNFIEVLVKDSGQPFFNLHPLVINMFPFLSKCQFHLSISHTKENAIAYVIIEE